MRWNALLMGLGALACVLLGVLGAVVFALSPSGLGPLDVVSAVMLTLGLSGSWRLARAAWRAWRWH